VVEWYVWDGDISWSFGGLVFCKNEQKNNENSFCFFTNQRSSCLFTNFRIFQSTKIRETIKKEN